MFEAARLPPTMYVVTSLQRSLPSLCEIITFFHCVHPVMWISEKIKIVRIKVDSKLSHMSKSNVRLFVSIYYGAKRGKSKLGEAEFGHYENTRLWFMFDEINIGTRSDAIKYFYPEPLKPFLFVCAPLDKCVHLTHPNLFDLLNNWLFFTNRCLFSQPNVKCNYVLLKYEKEVSVFHLYFYCVFSN